MARDGTIRFRTIVIIFNVVIVLSFLFIFLVPLSLLGPSYFPVFLSRNWIAGLLFLAALGAVNGYFATNWKLFGLLERDDWPALIQFLEARVYRKGRLRGKHVRLLTNAYLICSRNDATRKLEKSVRERRPDLVRKLAVQFGIPYLLEVGSEEAEGYFAGMSALEGVAGREWLRWNHAFSLCRRGEREKASGEIEGILASTREPVLRVLSLYLLETGCGGEAARALAKAGRAELRGRYTREQWSAVVERARSNLEVLVLSRVLEDASSWLYREEPSPAAAPKVST